MNEARQGPVGGRSRRAALTGVLVLCALALFAPVRDAAALGAGQGVEVRRISVNGLEEPIHPRAAERLAWEIRKRTSIETTLSPTSVRLDDPSIYKTPFLYWSGGRGFPALSEAEITGLRRFVEYGGFVLIDDASPEGDGFDESVRRELVRAFPSERFVRLSPDHTIFRSFYLLSRVVGRLSEPDYVEAISHAGRVAVLYSRHDLGAAWAFDGRSHQTDELSPSQRETAVRFGVNVVMYALCLDYKDDQVHAPFILRRRGGRP